MNNQTLSAQIMSTPNTGQAVSWYDKLAVTSYDKQSGTPKYENSINNILIMLREHPEFAGKIRYNSFINRIMYGDQLMRDEDISYISNAVEQELHFYNKEKIVNAINLIAQENQYHPIMDYLDSLEWDGIPRVDRVFTELLEADDDELTHLMTRLWFIAAVRRVYEPGCKFDSMILLTGAHGIGKSVACRLLSNNYYCEFTTKELEQASHQKDLFNRLGETWIANGDELKLTQRTMEDIKSLISTEKFKYRRAYGRFIEENPIHCVFIGSTNESEMLKDYSTLTERRFWVIECHKTAADSKVKDTLTQQYVDQLWAEAVQMYKQDPSMPLYIANAHMQEEFAEKQKKFKTFNNNPVVDWVRDILDREYCLNQFHAFDTPQAFLAQVQSPEMYGGKKEKLSKLPYNYLIFVLKKIYGESCSVNMFRQAFGDEWEVKKISWQDSNKNVKTVRGIKRADHDGRVKDIFLTDED